MFERFISFIGVFVLLGIAFLFSKNKKAINWRTVFWGGALQFIFALIVLKTAPGQVFFNFMNDAIVKILSFQEAGAQFVFGGLGIPPGKPGSNGFYFAFQVLTAIIFFSSLASVLYYLGIAQKIVMIFAKIMHKTCQISGAESLSASANIFVGQTEAPILIKPYLEEMTESELFCVMTGGMATVAGSVMAGYIIMLKPYFPGIAGHLLAASVMSAPAAIMVSKLMMPETGKPKTMGTVRIEYKDPSANVIDAAASGATTGLQLALNVGTMLVAFMSLLALLNAILGAVGGGLHIQSLSLEKIFGWIFSPLAWLMGVPASDMVSAGRFMGEKTAINEFVAYVNFAEFLKANPAALAERTKIILTYALCGFSNFLSIGILIGGMSALAPKRRDVFVRLGLLSLVGGSIAAFLTGTIAGIIL